MDDTAERKPRRRLAMAGVLAVGLLTGSTATKVTDAALKAVPGATVIRVETDSEGAAYEAHQQKADGSYVTVELDQQFDVTGTEDGFGGPCPGGPGHMPPPPVPGSGSSNGPTGGTGTAN